MIILSRLLNWLRCKIPDPVIVIHLDNDLVSRVETNVSSLKIFVIDSNQTKYPSEKTRYVYNGQRIVILDDTLPCVKKNHDAIMQSVRYKHYNEDLI